MIPAILCVAFITSCGNTESAETQPITVEERNAAIESAMELLQASQTIEALAITSILIAKDPDSPQSQETHALALMGEGWRHDNLGEYTKAKEKRTAALDAYILACEKSISPGLLQLSTAQLAHMTGEIPIAIQYYKLAHTNVPNDPRASFFLGQIALLDKQWTEAKGWIAESLNRVPDEPFAILSLALIEAELGNTELATSLAMKGCSMLPEEPNLRFIQARVLRLSGHPTQAWEILSALPKEFQGSQMYIDELNECIAEVQGGQ